jgi:hypothetical protein
MWNDIGKVDVVLKMDFMISANVCFENSVDQFTILRTDIVNDNCDKFLNIINKK